MKKTFLFDLDGTLLGLDQDKFLGLYFSTMKDYVMNLKHDYKVFFYYLELGINAMLNNDGSKTNEEAFILATKNYSGILDILLDYYNKSFIECKKACFVNPYSVKVINYLKEKGYDIILATNPLFPLFVTKMRIDWAGINSNDFKYITSYENSCYTKPKYNYFMEILNKFNLKKEDVIYVGNDVSDDYLEIKDNTFMSFLIKDCLINKENLKFNIKELSMEEFYNYIKENA